MTAKKKHPADGAPAAAAPGAPPAGSHLHDGTDRHTAAALRRRAEAALREIADWSPEDLAALAPEDTRMLLHEWRVHQIELETQNEELRLSQVELVAARARYFDLYDLAPVGYCTLSSPGLILQANFTTTTLLGVTRSALVQQPISRFIHQEDAGQFHLLRQRLIATRKPESCELRMVKKDGTQFWAQLAATGAPDAEGGPAIRLVLSDVTRRKQAEDERKRQETQKHESLGVLAAGIAHDFNSILTVIVLNSHLVHAKLPPGSPLQTHLNQIEKSSLQAAGLCTQMLAYSGHGRFVVQRLDLSQLVEETAQLQKLSIGRQAVLRFHLDKGLPPIEADATQLRQVIVNLVINASDAIGEETGGIDLTTGLTLVDHASGGGSWQAPDVPEGAYVWLEVADSGCGMSAETQARIFDPFFTTKFLGRGLSLAAVLGIVRRHQGAITVNSEPGRGTTFKVWFPAKSGSGEAPTANPTHALQAGSP